MLQSAMTSAASSISNAQTFPTLLLYWQLWALLSEVVLAITHLKVLLCIGKPIPAKDLSNKRWTYFLYDLISPWAALASIVAPYVLHMMAARADSSTLITDVVPHATSSSNSSSSGSLLDVCKPLLPLSYPQQAPGYCSYQADNSTNSYLSGDNITATAAAVAAVPLVPHTIALLPITEPIAAAAAGGPAIQPSVQQLLLLFVGAHAALHVYYIASWHSSHSRNVVRMSASSSMSSRAQHFDFWEVVWFFIGTSYDILTHVVMCGLLLQSLGSNYSVLWV